MKKAITILAILIVLVSAVFAAETHKLTVRADVEETLPAFNLSYGGKNTNTVVTNVYGTNSDVADPASLAYDISARTVAGTADAGFNLNANDSFIVNAQVINAVKTNKAYTLEFGGGVFAVKRNTADGKLSPKQIRVADTHTSSAITSVGSLSQSTVLTAEQTKAANPTPLTASAVVTFSGTTGDGTVLAPLAVASATYEYIGDDTIDPISADGDDKWYYADITLTVTYND